MEEPRPTRIMIQHHTRSLLMSRLGSRSLRLVTRWLVRIRYLPVPLAPNEVNYIVPPPPYVYIRKNT